MIDLVRKIQDESAAKSLSGCSIDGISVKLTKKELSIIPYINRNPGCNSRDISHFANVEQSYANVFIRSLVKKGLIIMKIIPSNKGMIREYCINQEAVMS